MMASKQRSFFDENPSKRRLWNPHWRNPANNVQRTYSDYSEHVHYSPRVTNNTGPTARPGLLAVPAIAASSQSRRKLRAFRYGEGATNSMDTENIRQLTNGIDVARKDEAQARWDAKNSASQNRGQGDAAAKEAISPEASRTREYPQTPLARVPFADLVENGEAVTIASPIKTPHEGVTWRQSPTSSDVDLLSQRGKKRARSSSPVSSQRTSHFHPLNVAPVSLQDLHSTFRHGAVSDIDPALDLEKRYFGARSIVTPSKVSSSAAADLMHSSSPHTPALDLTESAKLRRTRSCGIAFPASDTKRRKIAKSYSHVGHTSPTQSIGLQQRDARISKMSLLLDKVDKGLSDAGDYQGAGSIDSISFPNQAAATTLRHHGSIPPVKTRLNERSAALNANANMIKEQDESLNVLSQEVANTSLHPEKEKVSSEYDDNELEALAATLVGSGCEEENPQSQSMAKWEIGCDTKDLHNDNDDDFMDDLTAADLEVLAASCDQPRENVASADIPSKISARAAERGDASEAITAARVQEVRSDEQPQQPVIDISSDEEFGGNDFDDIARECDELAHVAEQSSADNPPLISRYVVKDTHNSVYTNARGLSLGEKVLHIQDQRTKARRIVLLREVWLDSPVEIGLVVHVLATFNIRGEAIIDNAHGLLIIHPDHLFSATVVADAFKCTRRAVLQDRVKATNEVSESQVFGHMLHEVFQEALKANRWDTAWLESTVRKISLTYLESLFELNMPLERCVDGLLEKLSSLEDWSKQFVSTKAQPTAVLQGMNNKQVPISINKLLDVEEHIWSPRYGLKGNVDATVQVHASMPAEEQTLTVPFELKTGRAKNDAAHNSQTALYTLLLSDRYDVQIAFGILYYLETNATNQILAPRRDIMHMLMKRNELATYAYHRDTLPPMLQNEFTCGRCYAQTPCFVYHKLVEEGNGKTSGMGVQFKELMGHLSSSHAAFFKKWDDLLTKEEGDVLRFRRELWSMLSSEREKVGRCFGNVVIKPGSANERSELPKINRFEYTFTKESHNSGFSFAESQLSVGEPIVVSDEAGHFALANGYITRIRPHELSVAVDRRLHNARVREKGFDARTNQCFTGIMDLEASKSPQMASDRQDGQHAHPVLYRVDKDEFSNGMATVRNNLIRMMEKGLFGANTLRRLIIDGVPPTFRGNSSKPDLEDGVASTELNVDQRNAIRKVMSADNYALVLGMPGTGKTTTIAHIIRSLVARGKSVLLTSYTHTAVDNILLKIRDTNFRILRIGALSKIHPEVQEFADLACYPKKDLEAIQRSYQSEVVATTCLGINHPVFNHRTFDYCVVDEASQITLPVCLGPIRMAHRFVLVGDHYQLPPLVQNKEAQEAGLDISLFKLLSERQPESVVNLEHQYRMCADIMSLSNTIIYGGLLKCGTPEVASRKLHIPHMSNLKQHHHSLESLASSHRISPCLSLTAESCWLRNAIDSDRPVIFLNTDLVGDAAREAVAGSRITNHFEVSLSTQIVRALLTVGLRSTEIGVMTPYRSQLALLRQSLRARAASSSLPLQAPDTLAELEMHTADKFQGRDKEAILLSLVRSNSKGTVGDLLQDWRRLNVALTRARTKLFIIGSFNTVRQGSAELEKLCQLIDARGWRMDLRPQVLEEHYFEACVTQPSGKAQLNESIPIPGSAKSPAKTPAKKGNHLSRKASPLKVGNGLAPERILKKRPILQDIVNGIS